MMPKILCHSWAGYGLSKHEPSEYRFLLDFDMTTDKPKWQRLHERTVYKGRVHIIEHDVVLSNGETTKYEVDHAEGCAVAVLIKTKNDEIFLTHQYRFPLDDWVYGLPAGGAPFSETPEEGIKRECQEEIGVLPKKLIKLTKIYLNPVRSDWPVYIFYCDDYEDSKVDFDDPSENVEHITMPIHELKELIDRGKIVDPALLIAWYVAKEKAYIKP